MILSIRLGYFGLDRSSFSATYTHTILGNFARSHPSSLEAPAWGSSSTSSENQPGTTRLHFSKRTEASGGEEETSGAVGAVGGGRRGHGKGKDQDRSDS